MSNRDSSGSVQHSLERLFSSIFRRISERSRGRSTARLEDDGAEGKATATAMEDGGEADAMPVTDADTESVASTSSGAATAAGGTARKATAASKHAKPAPRRAGGKGRGSGSGRAASAGSTASEDRDGDVDSGRDDNGESPLPDFLTPEELQQLTVKPRNLQRFSERLTDFVRFVQRVQGLARATYEHPAWLQRRLERDVNELHQLLLAVRDATSSVRWLRAQRSAVHKESSKLRKQLKKLREDEVREMESIVAIYDKPMYTRWEDVRHTHKPEYLYPLLNDAKGKQQAMENLCTLIHRKKAQLLAENQIESSASGGSVNVHAIERECGTSASSSGIGGGALPAGLLDDPPSAVEDDAAGGSSRTVALRRRMHHERQDWQLSGGTGSHGGSTSLLTRWEPDIPIALALPLPPPPPPPCPPGFGPSCFDEDDDASDGGSDDGVPGPSMGGGSSRLGRSSLVHTELHEMRGVLQVLPYAHAALFSDLRIGSVSNVEDIDLFTVHPPQPSNQH